MQVLKASVPRESRPSDRNSPALPLRAVPWKRLQLRNRVRLLATAAYSPRQATAYILIVAGTALCTYVAGAYFWMFAEQQVLLHRWKSQSSGPVSLTKISIPKIHLEDVVFEGATRKSLLRGPAHLSETALPGETGNAVIAGHRDTFFRRIHSLRYGDDIYVFRSGKQFHYVVRGRKIVRPQDVWVLRATKDGQLTLITCYPTNAIGPAPKRLVVIAKLAAGT